MGAIESVVCAVGVIWVASASPSLVQIASASIHMLVSCGTDWKEPHHTPVFVREGSMSSSQNTVRVAFGRFPLSFLRAVLADPLVDFAELVAQIYPPHGRVCW